MKGGGGEKKEKPRKTYESLLVPPEYGLRWGLTCVSMCHGKSAQLSHPGWGEHENKGLEQPERPRQRGGETHQATKTAGQCCGQAALWSGSARQPRKAPWQRSRDIPEGRGGGLSAQGKAALK